jgi:glycosyltransferase involved in cell wall biosynthesis
MDERFPVEVLVSGQVLTCRIETIEDYLRPRVPRLGVIGLASPFAASNVARCVEYRDGAVNRSWPVRSVLVGSRNSFWRMVRLTDAFANYYRTIERCARRMERPFDLFVGISCFSAYVGLALRRRGLVKRHVYYSTDYYPPPSRMCADSLMVAAFRAMDRRCARSTDLVWHVTPRIADARQGMGGVSADSYPQIAVPLCYRASLCRFPDAASVERWTIGFVGTITETQGVQLLVEAMPGLARRFPELKVRVVGRGPYSEDLQRLVREKGMADRFVFHGFIEDEEEMLEIIARCAVAVAPWPQSADNNILFADPGKPKLYMCLGVPCVITRGPDIAAAIEAAGAGAAIHYDRVQLETAIADVLVDDARWMEMRRRAHALGGGFVSEKVLAEAMTETLRLLWPKTTHGRKATGERTGSAALVGGNHPSAHGSEC